MAGKMMQMAQPMVDPMRPRTSWMSGTRTPMVSVARMTASVIAVNSVGGMYVAPAADRSDSAW